MTIKANIIDPATEHEAEVDYTSGEKQALVVATRPLKTFENKTIFFTNETYGANLNLDASTGDSAGANEVIYAEDNGVAGGEWDASAISGTWDFASADQAFAGSVSIDATATANNNTTQLANDALVDLSDFAALTGVIYVTSWGVNSEVNIFGWNTATPGQVGTAIDLSTYIDTGNVNVWQSFSIPLADMSLSATSIDAIRIVTVGPPNPNYYLDAIELEGAAGGDSIGPTEFRIEPALGTWLRVCTLQISVADSYDSTVVNGTMPSIPYDGFLGLGTLANGILYQRVEDATVKFSASITQLLDFMQLPNAEITGFGGDDTNSWFTARVTFATPLILRASAGDYLSLTLRDDMSTLLSMRAVISGAEETR